MGRSTNRLCTKAGKQDVLLKTRSVPPKASFSSEVFSFSDSLSSDFFRTLRSSVTRSPQHSALFVVFTVLLRLNALFTPPSSPETTKNSAPQRRSRLCPLGAIHSSAPLSCQVFRHSCWRFTSGFGHTISLTIILN